MTTTGSPRRRPHPARRARQLTGYLSIAGMVTLTGCMAAAAKASTATRSTAGATQSVANPVPSPRGESDDYGYSDDSYVPGQSAAIAAAPGTQSAQPITSSHGS